VPPTSLPVERRLARPRRPQVEGECRQFDVSFDNGLGGAAVPGMADGDSGVWKGVQHRTPRARTVRRCRATERAT
jgi:hypothetical protein